MKKNVFFVLTAMLLLHISGYANIVSQNSAETVAINFFKIKTGTGAQVTAVLKHRQLESDGSVDFYVFDMTPTKGFVIVSAHDNSIPVIGYSTSGYFNPNASHTGVGDWMKGAAGKIRFAVDNNLSADPHTQSLWTSYMNGVNPNANMRTVVIGPLCTTNWNQDTYYNQLCPFDAGANIHTYTGCVATTMAQIMHYWSYPIMGTGSHSYYSNYGNEYANFNYRYNWSNMPTYSRSTTSPIDTLMYHCGVSVEMNYGPTGSGAQVRSWGGRGNPSAENSYTTYFHYNPNTIQGVYMSSYSATQWMDLMRAELNAGRLVQYIGDDATAGGHTWVCDGYDDNNMLHMNWGWGGSDNGYFAVTSLNAGGANFIQNESALIGIQPLYPFTAAVAASKTALCEGELSTLTATGPSSATYSWSPSTGLSCTSCAAPTATPTSTTLYTVTIDSSGVQAIKSVALIVTPRSHASYQATPIPGCSMPELVTFNNTSTNSTGYRWDFGDGTTATGAVTSHIYHTQGFYTATLYATSTCGTDTFVGSHSIPVIGGAPYASDMTVCPGSTATLVGYTAGSISWMDSSLANILGSTDSFTTPALTATTVYYVSADMYFPTLATGPASNSIGTGAYSSTPGRSGIKFNATSDQTLMSMDVYSNVSGSALIALLDNSGNVLDSVSVTLSSGHRTISLGFPVSAGSGYSLVIMGTNHLYYSTSGVSFPYVTSDGTVTLVSNSDNSTTNYNHFYNIKFQQVPCSTPAVPVTAYVLSTGSGTFTSSTNASTVTFSPQNQSAATYSWDFGDGTAVSTQMSPAHTYTAGGTYTVTLTLTEGSCTETITRSVSVAALGINPVSATSSLTLSPNPAKDNLTVTWTSDKQMNAVTCTISNVIGQTQISSTLDITSGTNKFDFNVSQLANGVYFVNLHNGKETLTRKFVKGGE